MTARRSDLLLAHDFPPMRGGIARWMAALAAGYPPGTLTISTGAMAGATASDATFVQRIDRVATPVERLHTFVGMCDWARRAVALARDPATHFAWCDTIRPAGYAARWAFGRTGVPYGIMLVGNDLLVLRRKIARSAIRRRVMQSVLGDAAVLVAISEWTAGQCRALLGDLDLPQAIDRVRVVRLGTDPDRFRADAAGAAAFRARGNLPAGRWLLTVARLVEYKGVDTGIRLMARLQGDYPDLRYAVVGRGAHEGMLRALAAKVGAADRLHFLTDVNDVDLPAVYSMASLYLGLTRETPLDVEGFGLSMAEAAACGVPVIGARAGGIPDAVVDGATGVLVDPEDLTAIDSAARHLLANPELARQMGVAGRARVEAHLNWDRVVGEMRAIADEFGRTAVAGGRGDDR